MAKWYVDPTAIGLNNGTSPTDAWTSLQGALDAFAAGTVVDGDSVYCRGTETLTTAILIKAYGSYNNRVRYIGVNSSWNNDGTQYVLDANSTATYCLDAQTYGRYSYWENFKFINATSHGVNATGANSWLGTVCINCEFSNNGGDGFGGTTSYGSGPFINCVANNNSGVGIRVRYCEIIGCSACNNGSYGFYLYDSNISDSIACSNAYGMIITGGRGVGITRCVADGNTGVGFQQSWTGGALIAQGCRATNNGGYGFNSTEIFILVNCAYRNNSSGNTNGDVVEIDTVSLTSDGYVDRANGDYRLTPSAEARGFTFNIDGTNNYGVSAGLQNPEDYPAASSVQSGITFNTSEVGTYTGSSDYPSENDVRLNVSYNFGANIGNLVIPSPSDVESSVQFGASGIEYTGILISPSTNYVLAAVGFGANNEFVGNLVLPSGNDVRNGVNYGSASGTSHSGSLDLPSVNDVEYGVSYDGATKTGVFVSPSSINVRNGIGYGASGTEFSGNLVLPSESDVENGILYGASGTEYTGNVVLPDESDVKLSVQFGANGTEFTGTYSPGSGVPPSQPAGVSLGIGPSKPILV